MFANQRNFKVWRPSNIDPPTFTGFVDTTSGEEVAMAEAQPNAPSSTQFGPQTAAQHEADVEECKQKQNQLQWLLHAQTCHQHELQANQCPSPRCKSTKLILKHLTTCQAWEDCLVPLCVSSRQIITHWKQCDWHNCPVCLPVMQVDDLITKHINNPEKCKKIRQQVIWLSHASSCQEREIQANGAVMQCMLPYCETGKSVLSHLRICQVRTKCAVPYCSSSRQILSHCKRCVRVDCPLCAPIRQRWMRKGNPSNLTEAFELLSIQGPPIPTNPLISNLKKIFDPLCIQCPTTTGAAPTLAGKQVYYQLLGVLQHLMLVGHQEVVPVLHHKPQMEWQL